MKKCTKILYLRTDIGDGNQLLAGGSVAHTLGVIQGFISHDCTVTVATCVNMPVLASLPLHRLAFLTFPAWLRSSGWKITNFLATFWFLRQATELAKQEACEVVYQRYSMLNFTGVLLKKALKLPLILEFNGSEVWVEKNWVRRHKLPLTWLIRSVENLNITQADRIVVVSEVLCNTLTEQGVPRSKIVVNPNGVDPALFDPEATQDERLRIRGEYAMQDAFVFGFIGTFSYWHGVEVLAHMIPEVLKKNHRVHFLLMGDGPLLGFLKNELKAAGISSAFVTFTGTVPQQEARNYLAACDAFLCPTQPNADGSRFFGSPTKVFEYMSMGKPVIASNLEQLAELIYPAFDKGYCEIDSCPVSDQVGIVIAPDNAEGFVRAACKVAMLDDISLQKMGKNARDKVMRNYTWHDHVARIVDGLR